MLIRTVKSLITVLFVAGVLAAKSGATATVTDQFSSVSSISRPRPERAPRRHPRPIDGCVELPAPAPVPVPTAGSCS